MSIGACVRRLSWQPLLIACCCLAPWLPAPVHAAQAAARQAWWQHAVIYEIYPRSFQDSDGDGTGDLNGITQRLDYLQALGVDAIWIAPMYPSPQVDFGYDISDYENIDPRYGTLADFDRLVRQAGKRHIRVILDMVLNHTSDQHPWFQAAASSRTDPKHDWYIWNDGIRDGGASAVPPNNWVSLFGGSAWEWSDAVGQFYYHEFYKQQPDLNWRNPEVERAMFDSMRFWLKRGVAGFRLDAITCLFEDTQLRDEPALGGANAQGDPNLDHIYTNNLPQVHDSIRRMRAVIASFPGDRVLIGETYLPNTAELDKWYGGERHDELQLPMDMLVGFTNKLDVNLFRQRLSELYTQVHGSQPLLVFDNHDNIRSWDRYGDGVHNAQIARLIATLLLTSRATALLYQGEELGQPTTTPTRIEDVKDPIGISGWPKEKGRDGERTPMQWDNTNAQAAFSTNPNPWLPLPANYHTLNVRTELADPDSLLNWHKRLIALRRTNRALREGRVVMLDQHNPNVLSYARVDVQGGSVLVALNMSGEAQTISLDLAAEGIASSVVTTLLASPSSLSGTRSVREVQLPPYASWVAAVQ
jgi:alpha-glucosidase